MNRVIVGTADCRVEGNPDVMLSTYALGSCVGLAVYDRVPAVGGLLHFMLPDSRLDPELSRSRPYMFADVGIPLLLEKVCTRGARPDRLTVCIVGAAQILNQQDVFEIGKRNYQAARRLLWKLGILLSHEAVGGVAFRNLSLEIATGKVVVQEGGRQQEIPLSWKKGGPSWRIAS